LDLAAQEYLRRAQVLQATRAVRIAPGGTELEDVSLVGDVMEEDDLGFGDALAVFQELRSVDRIRLPIEDDPVWNAVDFEVILQEVSHLDRRVGQDIVVGSGKDPVSFLRASRKICAARDTARSRFEARRCVPPGGPRHPKLDGIEFMAYDV